MKWLNPSQVTLQFPRTRFGLIIIQVLTLIALLAILFEGTVSVVSLCRVRRKTMDTVLQRLWVTRNRVAVVTAGCLMLSILAKSITGIVAVNRLQTSLLRTYFLLQVLILIQSVILICCDFHSAAFFLISSAAEMSTTAVLLLRVRRSGIMAAVVIVDANAIEMQQR